MTEPTTKTVTIERELAHAPEKVWRALTEPHLLKEWLMESDFAPSVGHTFAFRTGWGQIDCRVLSIQEGHSLSYTWDALGLESVVTFTISPSGSGTHFRMEQSGFQPDQKQAYGGAKGGWRRFVDALERVLTEAAQHEEGK